MKSSQKPTVKTTWDFPRGPAAENPLCGAGDTSLTPAPGTEIPHAADHPGPGRSAPEPACCG